MNRLFSKLKDFGLVFNLESLNEDDIITTSKALKKADNPVALFSFNEENDINAIKISNENEDMFLGALCPDNFDVIKKAIGSGAHFIVSENPCSETIRKCRNDGYDLIAAVQSQKELKTAIDAGAEAIVIEWDRNNSKELIEAVLNSDITLFLSGAVDVLPFKDMADEAQFCAYIIKGKFNNQSDITTETNEIIFGLLGLRYSNLSLRDDSPRSDEAAVFCALSSIPLFRGGDKDLLTITVGDMDRTIAHLKWKDIYMDPLSAKMNGSKILETELYTEFLGWTVRLISR